MYLISCNNQDFAEWITCYLFKYFIVVGTAVNMQWSNENEQKMNVEMHSRGEWMKEIERMDEKKTIPILCDHLGKFLQQNKQNKNGPLDFCFVTETNLNQQKKINASEIMTNEKSIICSSNWYAMKCPRA